MPLVVMPDGHTVDMPDKLDPATAARLQQMHPTVTAPAPAQQPAAAPASGIDPIEEGLKVTAKTALGGLTSLPELAIHGGDWLGKKFPSLDKPLFKIPEPVQKAYRAAAHTPEPESQTGKIIANIGSSAVGALGPGELSTLAKLGIGAGAGAGGELAARALQSDNAGTRLAGGLVGGTAAALVGRHVPNTHNILRDAMEGFDPKDLPRILTLRNVNAGAGIPSAATQYFGGKTTLPEVFARAASNPAVRPTVDAALDGTNTKAAEAVRNWQAQHLPTTGAAGQALLTDVQEASDSYMKGLLNQSNVEYTNALPPNASRQPVAPAQVQQLTRTLRDVAADPNTLGGATSGNKFVRAKAAELDALVGKPKNMLVLDPATGKPFQIPPPPIPAGYLNNTLKDLNTAAEAEGFKGLPLGDTKDALRAATPEFQPARDAKAAYMENTVNPAKRGLVGQIAEMGGGVRDDKFTAKESIIPLVLNDHNRQPGQITELGTQIGNSRIGAILDTFMNRKTAETIKGSKNRASELQQPFDLQAKIRGTTDSALRSNVDAALRASAAYQKVPAADLQKGFHSLLDGLETYRDLKVGAGVDRSAMDAAATRNAVSYAVAPSYTIRHKIEDTMLRKVHKQIAEMALSPDGVEQLVAIGKSPKPEVIQTFLQSLIASAESGQDQQEAKPELTIDYAQALKNKPK